MFRKFLFSSLEGRNMYLVFMKEGKASARSDWASCRTKVEKCHSHGDIYILWRTNYLYICDNIDVVIE